MQVGELSGGVTEWRLIVLVNGVQRKAASVSWDGELSGDLPDEVAGVSGVAARTGAIRWAPQTLVESRPASPWSRHAGWPPKPGDRVEMWVGDDTTSWRVFTGRIDTGDGGPDSLSSKIVDDYDRLSRLVSIEPVAERMPARQATEFASWPHATTAIEPWYVAYRAMRAAGYGIAVPRYTAGTRLIEAELQGSYTATVGRLQAAGSQSSTLAWADGYTYLDTGSVRYWPDVTPPSLSSGRGVRMWLRWHGNRAVVSARFTNGQAAAVTAVRAGSTIELLYRMWQDDTVVHETEHIIPMAVGLPQWVDVLVVPGQQVHVAYPQIGAEPGTPNSVVSESFSVGMTPTAGSVIEDVIVNAFTIAVQATVMTLAQWNSQSSTVGGSPVRAWGRGLSEDMGSSTTITNRSAVNVLTEVGEATLTAMWFDEHGVLNWAPTNVLHDQQPVRTVTTAQDVFELGWTESLLSMRSQVRVDYRETALSLARRNEIVLYQPTSSRRIDAGDELEDFVGPDQDQIWLEPDMVLQRAAQNLTHFNLGWGSFFGGSFSTGTGEDEVSLWSQWGNIGINQIEPDRWFLRLVNNSTQDLSLSAPVDEPGTFKRWQGMALPIIRGRGRVEFTDAHVAGNTGAPSWAPALQHDLSVYGKKADAERIRDWLAQRLGAGLITLTDLEIAYDPRLQLGDVITVESLQFFGFEVDALIIGKSEAFDSGGASMSLTVRVLRTRTTHSTYAQFEAAYRGKTYGALENAWAGATYTEFEANPTERA